MKKLSVFRPGMASTASSGKKNTFNKHDLQTTNWSLNFVSMFFQIYNDRYLTREENGVNACGIDINSPSPHPAHRRLGFH